MVPPVAHCEPASRSDTTVTIRIVERVSQITGTEATALPPLYDAIDPEALDDVVDSMSDGGQSLTITFTYADHRITVNEADAVSVASTC